MTPPASSTTAHWARTLGQLSEVRGRLRMRNLLQRLMLGALAVGVAELVLLAVVHLLPTTRAAFPYLATVVGLGGLGGALTYRRLRADLVEAAWLCDRQLRLQEQTLTALEVGSGAFAEELRDRTSQALSNLDARRLVPIRMPVVFGRVLAVWILLAAVVALIGVPFEVDRQSIDQAAVLSVAQDLRRAAAEMDGDEASATRFGRLAERIQRKGDREGAARQSAHELGKMEEELEGTEAAEKAIKRLERSPSLRPVIDALKTSETRKLDRALTELERQLAAGGNGAGRRSTARALREAADDVKDRGLADQLRRMAALAEHRKPISRDDLRHVLVSLKATADRRDLLTMAVSRLTRNVALLGGRNPERNLDRKVSKGSRGSEKQPVTPPIRVALPASVVRKPRQAERRLGRHSWPAEEDELVRCYFRYNARNE